MNHHQNEKNNMFKKMLIFFTNPVYVTIWANFPRLVKEITNFEALYQVLMGYMQQHHTDTLGITTGKNDAYTNMVNQVLKKAQLAYVWAVDQGDTNLQEIFDVQKSDFNQMASSKALTKALNIRDALAANITSLASVQITQADLTVLYESIIKFENVTATTGTAKAHKGAGRKGIDETMQPLLKSLDLIDNMMVNSYSDSNHDMINEYLLTRHIDKMPTHH